MLPLLPILALLATVPQTDAQAGLQALDHQDYQRAQQIFSQLVAADPKNYASLFNLALAETGLKKNDDAINHYRQVLALKPGLYEAELNLGILLLRNGKAADAAELLRDAAKQKPGQARPQRYLGDTLLAAGDFNGAAEAYRSALAIDPKLAAAELGLGQTFAREGKLDDALPHYHQAVALDPNLKSFLLEIASAFSKSNRRDDAIALLKEFPGNVAAREELGRLYLETNHPADAAAQFEAAVQMSPTEANQLALATAYLKDNHSELASPILERALSANPNDYDLHMVVGRLHRDRRDFQAAANQFLAAASLRPDSPDAWNEAASVLVMAEQYPQALAALDKVHALNADKPGDLYYRAMVLDKMHQVKPALAAYQQFLAMSQGQYPDQEFVARQRSRILQKEASR